MHKSNKKSGVKAAPALGSCRKAVLSSSFALLLRQPPKGTHPSPALRRLMLIEIQLQLLIGVDKFTSSHFHNH